MRFLILASALLLPATSTAAADSPRLIVPKPPPSPMQSAEMAPDPMLEHIRSHDARVIPPKALGSTRSDCPEVATYQTARPGEPLRLHNLNELPPANAYAAVYRKIGGCEVPMLVGYDIGKR